MYFLSFIPLIVQTASVRHGLNKAQTKSLARLEQVSDKVFHEVTQKGTLPFKNTVLKLDKIFYTHWLFAISIQRT